MVVTETWGGTISGYCAIGIENSATAPAMVVTMAMTIASRGRSTNMAESIGLAPCQSCRQRVRPYRHAGPDALQSLHDDLLAPGEALIDDDAGPTFTARLDALDRGLSVLDRKNVDAALIGDQGRLGHHHFFFWCAAFKPDPHQLPVDQQSFRVRHRGAHQHRIGGAVDLHVDEVDFAQLVVGRSVGKSNSDLDALDVRHSVGLLGLKNVALAHRETDIHRVLADNDGQRAAVGTDDIPLGDVGAADLAGYRCRNVGVAEIDLGGLQCSFVA